MDGTSFELEQLESAKADLSVFISLAGLPLSTTASASTPAGSYKASDTGLVQVSKVNITPSFCFMWASFSHQNLSVPSLNELRGRCHTVIVRGKSIMFIKT